MSERISIHMQIAELQAELRHRRAEYPKLVSRGRMRASEAERKMACLEAALDTLISEREAGRT